MKHLKYFFLIAISIASSCNIEHNEIIDKEKTNAVSDSLISVQNNTKMVYIPGGVYKHFMVPTLHQ
ncbi:MAG: hypothetical protein UZ11_BCD004000335 [Bacteroidetes bacterium OLB11]|nr:MAG: hypothetical protein UZ11_BCD004000335 [Bacteroidetes bacterium OLB11]